MGDRSKVANKVSGYIQEVNPNAKTILELAVGTGTNLVPFANDYQVFGLDLSENMLQVAKEKLPNVPLYRQSMVDFKIDRKFDVIMCLFDSINHLLDLEQWKSMFRNVQQHLEEGGIFVFDVNTPAKLRRVVEDKPAEKYFDGNKMVMAVSDEGDGITNWNVKIYERKGVEEIVHEDNNKEVAFQTETIEQALKEVFSGVDVKPEPQTKNGTVERVYFVCKK